MQKVQLNVFRSLAMCGALLISIGCASNSERTTDDRTHQAARPYAHSASPTAFMTGHWIHDDNGTVMEEIWFPPHAADGSTAGVLRWNDPDGTVRMYELMSLSPTGDGTLSFQLRHFGGDMSPWASEADGPFRGIVDRPEPNQLRDPMHRTPRRRRVDHL